VCHSSALRNGCILLLVMDKINAKLEFEDDPTSEDRLSQIFEYLFSEDEEDDERPADNTTIRI